MTWDYFISHASEDKELVASPLAHYLKAADFQVWYDDFSLKLGDSLLQSINQGLSKSKFGIVVLSTPFFAKRWPQQELAGLYALEVSGEKRILPIWHQINSADVAQFSPILADRKAADTQKGLQFVAEQIVEASFPERLKGLPLSSAAKTNESEATLAREVLSNLLRNQPSTNDLFLYLSGYPILLENILGYSPYVIPSFKLPAAMPFDFAELVPHGITGPVEVLFVLLGPVNYDQTKLNELINEIKHALGRKVTLKNHPANDYLGSPYFGEYPALSKLARAIRDHSPSDNIHWKKPDTWSFRFMLLAGRRDHTPLEERKQLMGDSGLRIDIASYDRLLDDRNRLYSRM